MKQTGKPFVPKLEVLSPDWTIFLKDTLISLYHTCPEETSYMELLLDFQATFPEWQVQKEQLLVYWLYTYFCGAVYDEKIFAKGKGGVCTLFTKSWYWDSMPGNGENWNRGIWCPSAIDSPGTETLGSEPRYAGRTAGSGRIVFTGTSDDTV